MRVVTDRPVTTRALATAVHIAYAPSSVLGLSRLHHTSRNVAQWLS
jgi:GTP cyclohydrolase I